MQLSLQRTVAIKVLAPELAEDEKFRARFERESRLAALCDHPNIIPVYEAGETDGLLFIAMRWVDGNDLRAVLKREGPLDPERTLSILGQVAGALDAAHDRGLIHRDVKPANILVVLPGGVGMQEHVYLSDFGIAKMSSSAAFTRTGFFVGTPDYAAPEQFTDQDLDGRVDVYAVGCLLFQCLAGSPPFVRTQDVAVMYAHLHDPPPRLSEQRPEIPEALDDVIATAMAKQRDDRYRTAGEVIRAARAAPAVGGDLTGGDGLVQLNDVAAPETSSLRRAGRSQGQIEMPRSGMLRYPAGEPATAVRAERLCAPGYGRFTA